MGQVVQERLRLGKIGYLNVLPIYYPMESGAVSHSFSIVSGPPAHLNRLMAKGELDLSVVSSIEYARHPERYFILPDFSISCRGPVKSVLLISQVPVKELDGQTILVSSQSHTSVALLKILFSVHLGVQVGVSPGDCSDAISKGLYPKAILAIGDEALRLRHHSAYPFRWDLGEAWYDFTGLPFVFALWVVQRNAIEKWNGYLGTALDILSECKKWGRTHMDIVRAEALKRGILNPQEIRDYYECLGYDFGRNERDGLDLFYKYLVRVEEAVEAPRLEVFSPLLSVA